MRVMGVSAMSAAAVAVILMVACAPAAEASKNVAIRQVTSARSDFLTLALVEMRCPSQFVKVRNMSQKPGVVRGRHLLEEAVVTEETWNPITFMRRKLLGRGRAGPAAGAPGVIDLHEYRATSRAEAVAHAHEVCTGAPDDKGPAVFFPLHLDVDDASSFTPAAGH